MSTVQWTSTPELDRVQTEPRRRTYRNGMGQRTSLERRENKGSENIYNRRGLDRFEENLRSRVLFEFFDTLSVYPTLTIHSHQKGSLVPNESPFRPLSVSPMAEVGCLGPWSHGLPPTPRYRSLCPTDPRPRWGPVRSPLQNRNLSGTRPLVKPLSSKGLHPMKPRLTLPWK